MMRNSNFRIALSAAALSVAFAAPVFATDSGQSLEAPPAAEPAAAEAPAAAPAADVGSQPQSVQPEASAQAPAEAAAEPAAQTAAPAAPSATPPVASTEAAEPAAAAAAPVQAALGATVLSADGKEIGKINRVRSAPTGAVTEIQVKTANAQVLLVPGDKIASGGKDVKLTLTAAEAAKLPLAGGNS